MRNVVFLVVGLIVGGVVVNYYYQYSSFPGDDHGNFDEPISINAETANDFFKNYHSPFSVRLKTRTGGEIADIKTFIIRQSIIEHFEDLIRQENANKPSPAIQQAGLALTLGQNNNGSTLIVTALVCGEREDRDSIKNSRHLLPHDISETGYIYDHIDLCPHNCPENSFALSADEYYRNDPNRLPRYDENVNYWVRESE